MGDFNADGKPDYVLFNSSTRQTAIWYLNNNAFVDGLFGPTLPINWRVVGVADFNGDGKPDYLLFNSSTQQTAIWYLIGPTLVGGAFGPTLPAGWNCDRSGRLRQGRQARLCALQLRDAANGRVVLSITMFLSAAPLVQACRLAGA